MELPALNEWIELIKMSIQVYPTEEPAGVKRHVRHDFRIPEESMLELADFTGDTAISPTTGQSEMIIF